MAAKPGFGYDNIKNRVLERLKDRTNQIFTSDRINNEINNTNSILGKANSIDDISRDN